MPGPGSETSVRRDSDAGLGSSSLSRSNGWESECRSFVLLPITAHDHQRYEVEQQSDQEQGEAEREGGERLGAVELLLAGEQADDLHSDGGDAFERIERQIR